MAEKYDIVAGTASIGSLYQFFKLWSSNADGNDQLGPTGTTRRPLQATLEPRSIPGSNKILFTAAAHHSITGGCLCYWGSSYREPRHIFYYPAPDSPALTSRSRKQRGSSTPTLGRYQKTSSWSVGAIARCHPTAASRTIATRSSTPRASTRPTATGTWTCCTRTPVSPVLTPLPIQPRPRPPVHSSLVQHDGEQVGTVVLQDIYQGLAGIERGTSKRLRIVGVVPKVQPHMNVPSLGVLREETGKFVLASVPVGGRWFGAFPHPFRPARLLFRHWTSAAWRSETMRSFVDLQPGQTMSCVGCHESRQSAPPDQLSLAMQCGPSRLRRPAGSWPLRYDELVQQVLDKSCRERHRAVRHRSPRRSWTWLRTVCALLC